jgi:tetratricopeptide (TPR) repeat protein
MIRNWSRVATIFAAAALLVGATGCGQLQKLKARDSLNKGVGAFKNAKYPEAVEYFQRAVDMDPTFPQARLYLATAYFSQYIPGAESPENLEFARKAQDEYQKVLDADPKDELALSSIASLYYHQKKFDEAETWFKKVIAANPKNKEAYYTLGVITWARTFPKHMQARTEAGMKPEEAAPIKDAKVRAKLVETDMPIIDAGIKSLQSALEVDPEYDDAMAYLNLLLRRKADLADDAAGFKKYSDEADTWIAKNLETKKIKQARADKKAAQGQVVQE